MAFLDKSVTIFIDAVLTEAGRQALAQSGDVRITKFALADDGIDYSLFDVTHPDGPDSWDKTILNMPLLEAMTRTVGVTEDSKDAAMRSPLVDRLADTAGTKVEITGVNVQSEVVGGYQVIVFSPQTLNATDSSYTFTLTDDSHVKLYVAGETINLDPAGS